MKTFSLLLLLAAAVALVSVMSCGVTAAELEGAQDNNKVLCVCRCCMHQQCSYVANASWMLDSCSTCNAQRCQEMILSANTRRRIATSLALLKDLETVVTKGRSADAADSAIAAQELDDTDRKVMLQHTLGTLAENKWDVCEVTAMVETVTCLASGTAGGCQNSADLNAVCFDRNAAVVKYGTWGFLLAVFGGCALAFVKNYLIGCQAWNEAHFNY